MDGSMDGQMQMGIPAVVKPSQNGIHERPIYPSPNKSHIEIKTSMQ
jgi:hypothetical protein